MKALVIDEPWISKILRGEKTWEMRSRHATHRGPIALIRKGSGQIFGVAELVDSEGPLDLTELQAARDKHQIPIQRYESGELIKWDIAWKLANVRPLPRPVSYQHPFGAVTWVNLSPKVSAEISIALGEPVQRAVNTEALSENQDPCSALAAPLGAPGAPVPQTIGTLPVARDGTFFHPGLSRSGYFTIGEKGDEQRVNNFQDALKALRAMTVPRWRRPNDQGNWGIVSGIRWEAAEKLGVRS